MPPKNTVAASAVIDLPEQDAGGSGSGSEALNTPRRSDAADTLAQFASTLQAAGDLAPRPEPVLGARGTGKRGSGGDTQSTTNRGGSGIVTRHEPGEHASPEKKRKLSDAHAGSPAWMTPAGAPQYSPNMCDSHFIVHLFVTAIAEGRLQQGNLPQKTWDVLQQVVTKVSKEQNTTVTLRGATLEFKMRVFVCNSVEARAVGEYITTHSSQSPAPFVVLARQLSMAIAYNSETLDPTTAAVADRLRKQAKTRAVKEIREAIRECQYSIPADMLRGHYGALAPVKELEPQLSQRSVHVDLEGDPNRRYFFFDAKNRSREDSDKGPKASGGHAGGSSSTSHRQHRGSIDDSAHPQHRMGQLGHVHVTGALPPAVAVAVPLPDPATAPMTYPTSPVSPALARVQRDANTPAGGCLSPGGRDGAAALLALFNAVSAPEAARRRAAAQGGSSASTHEQSKDFLPPLHLEADDDAPVKHVLGSAPAKKSPIVHAPKHSLAAQAAANVLHARAPAGHAIATPQKGQDEWGHMPNDSYDISHLMIQSPTFKARMKLSVELPPTLELSPALKTPRTVSPGANGGLYAAVSAGDTEKIKNLLGSKDAPMLLQRAASEYGFGLKQHSLIPGSSIEYLYENKWLDATVKRYDNERIQIHCPGGNIEEEAWFDVCSELLREPVGDKEKLHGFTPLMRACTLEDQGKASEIVDLLLKHGAHVDTTDSHGNTCLHWAAMAGHADVIRRLGDTSDVDAKTKTTGDTALLLAARSGHSDAVTALLDQGADLLIRNLERAGIIDVAGDRRPDDDSLRHRVLDVALKTEPRLRTLVLYHAECEADYTKGLLDVPQRLSAVLHTLEDMPQHRLELSDAFPAAGEHALLRVHAQEYLDSLREGGSKSLFAAAARAAGAVCYAVDEVLSGRKRNAFCCVRPPGHRAPLSGDVRENGRDVVYALNNAALGAAHALSKEGGGVSRVAILNLDLNHCTGTEEWVRSRALSEQGHVLLCSAHVVLEDKEGGGHGKVDDLRNKIVNEPLNPLWRQAGGKRDRQAAAGKRTHGSGRQELRDQLTRRLLPTLRAFCPELIIVSIGFNGRVGDAGNPLQEGIEALDLMDEDYYWITQQIMRVASLCCKGRIVSVLEGGYGSVTGTLGANNYTGFASAAAHHVTALTGY